MSLRRKRWFLWGLTCGLLVLAAWVLFGGLQHSPSHSPVRTAKASPTSAGNALAEDAAAIDFAPVWEKPLQRVLFDPPPPPPKKVEKKPPPPLNITLLGTMIDDASSQAIIQDSEQNLYFRRVGDSVTPKHSEALIEKILPDSIEVRQGDHLTPVHSE